MVAGDPYDRREPRYRDSAIRSDYPDERSRVGDGYEPAPPGYREPYAAREREPYPVAPAASYPHERPVGAVPPARPVGYESRSESVHHDHHDRGFSIVSTLMGWGAATFFTLLATALLGALLGTPLAQDVASGGIDNETLTQAALASLVVLLVSVFIGYFLGGYTAGRMAGNRGGLHGLAIVGWTILVGILAALAGSALAQRFDLLAAYAPGINLAALTVPAVLSLLVTLAVMLGSAYLGGRVGDRSWERAESRRVSRYERRGRPL